MDYYDLANELMKMRSCTPEIQPEREISKSGKGELCVLNYLFDHNKAAYPKELSKGMMVSTARIAVILNHLEQARMITRTADPEDNRQIIVSLTRNGMELCEKKRNMMRGHLIYMLKQLGPDDAREYVRIQKRLMQIYSKE